MKSDFMWFGVLLILGWVQIAGAHNDCLEGQDDPYLHYNIPNEKNINECYKRIQKFTSENSSTNFDYYYVESGSNILLDISIPKLPKEEVCKKNHHVYKSQLEYFLGRNKILKRSNETNYNCLPTVEKEFQKNDSIEVLLKLPKCGNLTGKFLTSLNLEKNSLEYENLVRFVAVSLIKAESETSRSINYFLNVGFGPENVWIDENGLVYLVALHRLIKHPVDAGYLKKLRNSTTANIFPPEMYSEPPKYSRGSEAYMIGQILYYMFTGRFAENSKNVENELKTQYKISRLARGFISYLLNADELKRENLFYSYINWPWFAFDFNSLKNATLSPWKRYTEKCDALSGLKHTEDTLIGQCVRGGLISNIFSMKNIWYFVAICVFILAVVIGVIVWQFKFYKHLFH